MEKIEAILQDLIKKVPQIRAAAVANMEGIVMASELGGEINEENFGAISAALVGLGDTVLSELKGGSLSEVYVKGKERMLLLYRISKDYLLALSITTDASLGLLLVEVRKAAKLIKKNIEELEQATASSDSDVQELFGGDTSFLEGLSFTDLLDEE